MGSKPKKPAPTPLADVDDQLPFSDTPAIKPELKATLIKYPHIDCVWMNEEGTWYFAEKPGFTAFSREDILNG